jgi:hypothetical protein
MWEAALSLLLGMDAASDRVTKRQIVLKTSVPSILVDLG